MMIRQIELDDLSRDEYINFILVIIYNFKVDYEYFTEIEQDIIKNAIKRKEVEWNKKI